MVPRCQEGRGTSRQCRQEESSHPGRGEGEESLDGLSVSGVRSGGGLLTGATAVVAARRGEKGGGGCTA